MNSRSHRSRTRPGSSSHKDSLGYAMSLLWRVRRCVLLTDHENCKQDQPGQTHRVPVPARRIYGNLAKLDSFKPANHREAHSESHDTDDQVSGVQPGNDVEEVAGRG